MAFSTFDFRDLDVLLMFIALLYSAPAREIRHVALAFAVFFFFKGGAGKGGDGGAD